MEFKTSQIVGTAEKKTARYTISGSRSMQVGVIEVAKVQKPRAKMTVICTIRKKMSKRQIDSRQQ